VTQAFPHSIHSHSLKIFVSSLQTGCMHLFCFAR
jgi:hypothetical protein